MVGTKDEEVVLVIGAALAHGLDVVALTVLLAVSLAEGSYRAGSACPVRRAPSASGIRS